MSQKTGVAKKADHPLAYAGPPIPTIQRGMSCSQVLQMQSINIVIINSKTKIPITRPALGVIKYVCENCNILEYVSWRSACYCNVIVDCSPYKIVFPRSSVPPLFMYQMSVIYQHQCNYPRTPKQKQPFSSFNSHHLSIVSPFNSQSFCE